MRHRQCQELFQASERRARLSPLWMLALSLAMASLVPGCAAGGDDAVICGDGILGPGEECDDGNLQPGDGCSPTCVIEPGFGCTQEPSVCTRLCGNGRLDPGEDCDDAGESYRCNSDCTASLCGDGKTNTTAGEDCDDGGESAACNADCTTAVCGDGKLNVSAGEQCDDGNTTPDDGCDENCQIEVLACEAPFTSTYAGDNGWEGNMFDIVARRPLTVTGFDGHFHTGTQDIQIYYRLGTHVGFEQSASDWTFVGSATVSGAGSGNATPIPITVNVAMATNQRVAFYITTQGKSLGSGNIYSNGVGTGTLHTTTDDLHFYEGVGKYANFGTSFSDRIFNGTIYYTCQ